MAKNLTRVKLTGTGTWTVPAGVAEITIFSNFDGINSLSAGNLSFIRNQSGAVYAFGDGAQGGLGDNTIVSKSSPVAVVGGYSFISVVSSHSSAFAANAAGMEADGRVYTWGVNTYGQLGDNTVLAKSSPIAVVGGHSFVQIAAKFQAFHALKSNGSVWGWGYNAQGNLGDGTIINRSSPVAVVGGHSFVSICSGYASSLALKSDGSVWAWGSNTYGSVGDGTITSRSSPVAVIGGHSFVAISAGGAAQSFSMALKSDGSVWAWGRNSSGQLGDGTTTDRSSPVAVIGGYSFVQISAGASQAMARTNADIVYAWGANVNGNLGDGTTIAKSSPVPVVGGYSFSDISCHEHTLAVTRAGKVYSWGLNADGQLGDGTIVPKSSPVAVAGTYYIGTLGSTSMRRKYSVTPGQSIPYKADGLSAQYFGDYVLASDTTSLIVEYFS